MSMKSTEKMIEGLSILMDGFAELREEVEEEYRAESGLEDDEEEDEELSLEVDAAIVNEFRAAIEAVMENDETSTEDIATMSTSLTDALEEIDPSVFAEESEEDEEENIYYSDEELDDDDLDDDDDMLEEFDDDENYEDDEL